MGKLKTSRAIVSALVVFWMIPQRVQQVFWLEFTNAYTVHCGEQGEVCLKALKQWFSNIANQNRQILCGLFALTLAFSM